MNEALFKGTGMITKLLFRQLRVKIFLWIVGLSGISLAAASAYPEIYQDEEARMGFAYTVENPAMQAMVGKSYVFEDYLSSIGPLFATEMLLFTAVAVAIMNILLVSRSTRADEDDGRLELVRALSVGRLSYLSGSFLVIIVTNLILTVIMGIGLTSLGIEGMDAGSNFFYGFILASVGFLFAVITAVFAQLSETSRGTTIFSFSILIIAYLVRAIGDVSNESLSLVSPLGWVNRSKVFVDDNGWFVILPILFSILFVLLAFYLNGTRDVGSGFLPDRKGKTHASRALQSPLGLIIRITRVNIISWGIGVFILGAAFGAVMGDLEAYFADMDIIEAFLSAEAGSSMMEQFTTLLMAIMAVFGSIPAIMTVLKLKGEETKNFTENIYSRAVSRFKVLSSYLVLALVVACVMQFLVALGFWSVGTMVLDDSLNFFTTMKSALVYVPAMWVVIGLSALLVGLLPKFTLFVWGYVVYIFVAIYLGGLLEFPEWLMNLSVYEYIPQIPGDEMNYVPLVSLTVLAIFLSMVGLFGYRQRDIHG